MTWLNISLLVLTICGIVIAVMMKYAAEEVDKEMQKDIEAAKKEPSFYERMQMWKYGNEVISHCLSMEETE